MKGAICYLIGDEKIKLPPTSLFRGRVDNWIRIAPIWYRSTKVYKELDVKVRNRKQSLEDT